MKLNGKKLEHLHYGNRLIGNYFTGKGKVIKLKSTIKDLGVTLSEDATFKQHITNTVEKAQILVGWIMRTFNSRKQEVMITLWKSLVLPHLDYCPQLWSPNETKQIQQLIEDVQKALSWFHPPHQPWGT